MKVIVVVKSLALRTGNTGRPGGQYGNRNAAGDGFNSQNAVLASLFTQANDYAGEASGIYSHALDAFKDTSIERLDRAVEAIDKRRGYSKHALNIAKDSYRKMYGSVPEETLKEAANYMNRLAYFDKQIGIAQRSIHGMREKLSVDANGNVIPTRRGLFNWRLRKSLAL